MKYSNTAITQLTRWYKQILIKCAIMNAAILAGVTLLATPAMATDFTTAGGTDSTGSAFDSQPTVSVTGLSISDTTGLSDALAGKQATITDLTDIRSNATAGKGAADTIATYGDIVTHNASEFQTTIADLADIRSNAAAGKGAADTIATYGDIVTHDADEFVLLDANNTFTGNNNFTGGNVTITGGNLTAGITTLGATTVSSLTSNGAISGTTLTTTGAANVNSLAVTNGATVGGTLAVTGATTLSGDLQGTTATFTGLVNTNGLNAGAGNVTTTGALNGGTLTTTNAATIGGALSVGGDTSLKDTEIGGTLDVTGDTTLADLVADDTTLASLEVTGDTTLAGLTAGDTTLDSLEVTGDTVLADLVADDTTLASLEVTGTSTFTGQATFGDDGFMMKDGNVAKTLNDGSAAVTSVDDADEKEIASMKAVLMSAEYAAYDGTTVKGAADSTTVKSALDETTAALNNVLIDDGSLVDDAKVYVDWDGDSTLDAVLGDGAYTSTNLLAAGDSVTTALSALDDAIGDVQYTPATGVAYGDLTAGTDLTTVAAQLAYNIGDEVTNETNGVAADASVNANIDALNTALGDVSGVEVNGYTPGDLVGAVSALNGNMEAVLGDVYKDDGSYNDTVLVGNGFAEGSADLSDALTTYAADVQAAMGTTFDDDGTFENEFDAVTDVDYDGVANDVDLVTAIGQLNVNIGEAITGTARSAADSSTDAGNSVNANIAAIDAYLGGDVTATDRTTGALAADNTVKANFEALDAAIGTDDDLLDATVHTDSGDNNGVNVDNSVNSNIAALNAAVGDVSTLAAYDADASTGNAITNGGDVAKASTVVEALNNIDATLGQIHGLKMGHSNLQDKSNLADGTTVEEHLISLDDAIGDRSFDTTHYVAPNSDIATATRALDTNLYRLDNEVKDLRKDVNRGFASMAAMSALVPNARANGNTQVSVGTGMYSGHVGFALGGFHWFNDNILMNVGVAYGDGDKSDVIYRAGVTYSW